MQCIIGLTAKKGGGKGTFTKLVCELLKKLHSEMTVEIIQFSDILFGTLECWGIPTTRENLQKLPVLMEAYGPGTLAKAVRRTIEKSTADIVIIDGVRWDADVSLLRSFKNNVLVYIKRDATKRFEGLKSGNTKVGEGTMTWEQFEKEEQAPNEVLIDRIGEQADFTIDNNGTMEDYKVQVQCFYEAMLKTALT